MHHSEAKIVTDKIVSRLKERRIEQDLSHQTLADKAGVNRSTISRIESREREPTLINVVKIAHALNYELSELMN